MLPGRAAALDHGSSRSRFRQIFEVSLHAERSARESFSDMKADLDAKDEVSAGKLAALSSSDNRQSGLHCEVAVSLSTAHGKG